MLRHAIRSLLKAPGFTATVVLILALGIGANSAIFSIVNAVLLRPLPFRDPGRLCRFDELNPKHDPQGVSRKDMEAFDRLFEAAAAGHWQNVTLTGPEGAENVYGVKISAKTFPMLGTQPALGRVFRDEEFKPGAAAVTILSDRTWQQRYGRNPNILGRSILLNGAAHTVIGVMPPEFFSFGQRFALWTPWMFTAEELSQRDQRMNTIVRLKPGTRPEQVEQEATAILRSIAPEDAQKGWGMRLTNLSDDLTSGSRTTLTIALGAVGFVLLIACLNVANLLLARASDREHETAIRLALGAGRWSMIRQHLTESLLLAAAGGAAGLLLGWWAAKGLVATFPERIPLPRVGQTRLDGVVLLFTIGISLLTGLLFGLLPALQASRADVNDRLKEGGRGSSGAAHGRRLRSALIVAETALSLVLLAGAGLMLRSFDKLMRVDPGFQPDRVLTLRVPVPTAIKERPQQAAYYTRLLERMQATPGVRAAGLIVPLPLGEVDANGTFYIPGRPAAAGERQLVKLRVASAGYFRAMGITVKQGRVFNESDGPDAPQVAVISEALARKYFPNENPVGKRISGSPNPKDPTQEIIGVVSDVKFGRLSAPAEPELYRDLRQYFFAGFAMTLTLRTDAADPMALAGAAQREIRSANPDQPIQDVRAMVKVIRDSASQPRFYTMLLAAFAAIALALAATGLYGVLSFSVSRRSHEIGVRMAMGAQSGAIIRLVLREALMLVGSGIVLGLGGAAALTRLLKAELFETTPIDVATFAAVSALMIAVAVAAACIPARRAVGLDPVETLWGR